MVKQVAALGCIASTLLAAGQGCDHNDPDCGSESVSQSATYSKSMTQVTTTSGSLSRSQSLSAQLDCGLDGNDPSCKKKPNGHFNVSRSCKWHIRKSDFKLWVPSISEADIEGDCPLMDYGMNHIETCNLCGEMHSPCNDYFMSCKGCCGTKFHRAGVLYHAPSSHSCEALKAYYLIKNSHTCPMVNASDVDLGTVSFTVENNTQEGDTYLSGEIFSDCSTKIHKLTCGSVPVKLEFQCGSCNAGVPDLLEQCCDKCMEFAVGKEVQNLTARGIIPYVWCSGCNTSTVQVLELGMNFPFKSAWKYANRTEAKADLNMSTWVEDNVCAQFDHTCATTSSTATTTTTTTTTPWKTVLFKSGTGDSQFDNDWSCWREECGASTDGDGKRAAYNDVPLEAVGFSCVDSSSVVQWEVQYMLSKTYLGKTMLEIVSGCVPAAVQSSSGSMHAGNRRRVYVSSTLGYRDWDTGLCTGVGARSNWTGVRYPRMADTELRLAVGDGSHHYKDWILFAFNSGTQSHYGLSTSYNYMGFAGYTAASTASCHSSSYGGSDGTVYIFGYPLTTTTTTTATTTTTSTTLCLDRCTLFRLYDLEPTHSDGRRLQGLQNSSVRQSRASRFRNARKNLYQDFAVGSCGSFNFDVDAFYQKYESDTSDEALLSEAEEVVAVSNSSMEEIAVPTVEVASVVVSELTDWDEATLTDLKSGIIAGFTSALQVPAKDLKITWRMDEQLGMVIAKANATEEVAMFCDAFFTVTDEVKKWLRRTMRSRKLSVAPFKEETMTTTERPAANDTSSHFLPRDPIQNNPFALGEDQTVDMAQQPMLGCAVLAFSATILVHV